VYATDGFEVELELEILPSVRRPPTESRNVFHATLFGKLSLPGYFLPMLVWRSDSRNSGLVAYIMCCFLA
jgi:hypothetical protein